MTQEELDALMAGGLDDLEEESQDTLDTLENEVEEGEEPESFDDEMSQQPIAKDHRADNYRVSPDLAWPPPPPTADHKMVHQLDDVTRDSEVKATEIFDKLESINNFMVEVEEAANEVMALTEKNIELFLTLKEKFPGVERFGEALADNEAIREKMEDLVSNTQMGEDEIMMTMDIMQYQDIHRQKIERVINVMRALSKYMNSLFEAKIDDDKRVSSAVHIAGDSDTEEIVSNEDIEALIASLGKA